MGVPASVAVGGGELAQVAVADRPGDVGQPGHRGGGRPCGPSIGPASDGCGVVPLCGGAAHFAAFAARDLVKRTRRGSPSMRTGQFAWWDVRPTVRFVPAMALTWASAVRGPAQSPLPLESARGGGRRWFAGIADGREPTVTAAFSVLPGRWMAVADLELTMRTPYQGIHRARDQAGARRQAAARAAVGSAAAGVHPQTWVVYAPWCCDSASSAR